MFRDTGRSNGDLEEFKALLAAQIANAIDERRLTVRDASLVTGIAAADISRIRQAKLDRFTVDRLMAVINRLDRRVRVQTHIERLTPEYEATRQPPTTRPWTAAMQAPADIQDLVDNPRESLTVDLKEHVNLTDAKARAKIARHMCALANHGGGYLLFGFDDNGQPTPPPADIADRYHQDVLSQVIAKYLSPNFQCETRVVTSAGGVQHAVVRVPPHGAVPVCAKHNGPQDPKGRPQEIVSGTHYSRQLGPNGPESAPVITPEQWAPIIRRCVIVDRTSLLGMLDNLLRPTPISEINPAQDASVPTNAVVQWHDASHQRFLELFKETGHQWPAELDKHHYQLSYAIICREPERLPVSSMTETLRQVSAEVHDLVWTGWSMFYPFARPEIKPYVVPGPTEAATILEASLLNETSLDTTLPDVWRVSENGMATIIRGYREDRPGRGIGEPTTSFNPRFLMRELAELIRHARALAERFSTAEAVIFRCEWFGLKGRKIADGTYWSVDRISRANERVVTGQWPVSALKDEWPSIVGTLGSPILALFDPKLSITPDWVLSVSKTDFRTI